MMSSLQILQLRFLQKQFMSYVTFMWLFFSFMTCPISYAEKEKEAEVETTVLNRAFAWPLSIDILDPHNISSDTLLVLSKHFLETLLTIGENGEIQAGLAIAWELDELEKTITFDLRDDAVWSDGVPITAYTVKASIERALSPGSTSDAKPLLGFLLSANQDATIVVLDDYKIRFKVATFGQVYLQAFAHVISAPVPLHQLDENGKFPPGTTLASSGPYKLLPKKSADKISFVTNESYFGDKPYFSEVNFSFAHFEKLADEYFTYNLNLLEYVPIKQLGWLETYYREELVPGYNSGGLYLFFNQEGASKYNYNVRRSLLGILNQTILFKISNQRSERTLPTKLILKNSPDYKQSPLNSDYHLTIEQAQSLMRTEGYGPLNKLKMCVVHFNLSNERVINYLKSRWESIYVDLKTVNYGKGLGGDVKEFQQTDGQCNASIMGFSPRLGKPEEIIASFFETGDSMITHPDINKYKDKYKRMKKSLNLKEKMERVAELEKNLLEDYLVAAVGKMYQNSLVKPYIANYMESLRGGHIALSQYLTEK